MVAPAVLAVGLVALAVALGDGHHVAAGSFCMALALLSTLGAVVIDRLRDRVH